MADRELFINTEHASSSFKRTANNPRRFDKPLQLNDRVWKDYKNQARRLVSRICVEFEARKNNDIAVL